MATFDDTPTFNLKAVIQETGLKPDTLRAWERRYGLPQPQRTSGGHRLYSQHDIEMLKWLVARQEEGLSISRAVALWQQIEEDGQDPLQDPAYAVQETTAARSFIPEGDTITELRQAWLSACIAFDETKAEQIVNYALALFPAETVCFDILLKGLAEIGEGWYRGEVSVQQEHFAAELSMRRLEALIAAAPAPTRPGRIIVGCAPEDTHTFVPLLLTFLMKQRGWDVLYLGARVPVDRLEATVATFKPNLVILTAQQLTTAARLLEVGKLLEREHVSFAFGGRIFTLLPGLRDRIPGHFLSEELQTAPQAVERILTSLTTPSPAKPRSATYDNALTDFLHHQNMVEAEIWQNLSAVDIPPNYLSIANQALARNITAALTLGDINFLCTDIDWVHGLLENYEIPRELLSQYLNAYYDAAQKHLVDGGNPVLNWLAEVSGKRLKPDN
jgi:DNA-binding transcriptional MerR regulator